MNDKFNGIPIKDEYKPRHAYDSFNYNSNDNVIINEQKEVNKTVKTIVKKKRKIKKWVWNAMLGFFMVVFVFGVVRFVLWNKDNDDTEKLINEIQNNTVITEVQDDDNTEIVVPPSEEVQEPGNNEVEEPVNTVPNDYWYYIKFPLIDVDIASLKDKNSHTVGWINVNNTNINYPYVQYKDNSYYLNHSYDRSYNDAGWVFLDYRNNSNLDNKNTILYAHSRLDKTMFGSLSKVFRTEWHTNKDNHIIRLSTETENTLWQIFSVYKIEEEGYYITTEFRNDDVYNKFLETIKDRSLYNFNTELSSSDRILTLSTCYDDTLRTVVHAKLIKRSAK